MMVDSQIKSSSQMAFTYTIPTILHSSLLYYPTAMKKILFSLQKILHFEKTEDRQYS